MNIRRRALSGAPLLVAVAGAAALVTACSGGDDDDDFVTGNLVAPPSAELCVDATPPEATVQIYGSPLGEDGCQIVELGEVRITAEAEGHGPYEETLQVSEDTRHAITLTPIVGEEPPKTPQPRERGKRTRGKAGGR